MNTKHDCSAFGNTLKTLFGKIFVALFIVSLPVMPVAAQEDAPTVRDRTRSRPASFSKPVLIQFHGEINGFLTGFFNRSMDKAEAAEADLIILEVDSPGGLKIESLQMARRLRDCEAYTVVIVENEAISGGSLVSLGSDQKANTSNSGHDDRSEKLIPIHRCRGNHKALAG